MTLAEWLEPLPGAQECGAADRWAIEECGIDSLDLMERAGEGLAQLVQETAPQGPVTVVCGSGNNGGDGYVAARLLREWGRSVRVLAVGGPRTPDAHRNAALLGSDPEAVDPSALRESAVVVDAILGTGFAGEPREDVAAAIEAINSSGAAVVAADVPSGVDASTGEAARVAVAAVATATFGFAKPGHWLHPGKRLTGRLVVVDIGIPRGAPIAPSLGLIDGAVVSLVPLRTASSHKLSAGNVLMIGGSKGLTGALCLAAAAAGRAGAGYVTAFVPASLEPVFEGKLTETMTVALPDSDGEILEQAATSVLERSARGTLVLGPGLGTTAGPAAAARRVALETHLPLVVDAGGLSAFDGRLGDLASRTAPTVITPHEGELARLLATAVDDVRSSRLGSARRAAELAGAIVVLKGDDTIVTAPGGTTAISRGGAPALATAGTGDVLAGMLGAYIARGAEAFTAACAAVVVHLQAGRRAARAVGAVDGVVAGDVVAEIPRAGAELAARRL